MTADKHSKQTPQTIKETQETKEIKETKDTKEAQEAIVAMFDTIAKDYDKTNRILSLGIDISWRIDAAKRAYMLYKQNLAKNPKTQKPHSQDAHTPSAHTPNTQNLAAPESSASDRSQSHAGADSSCGVRIVDVACGSGDMMRHWQVQALRLGIGIGEVIGVDPSAQMLKLAHKKLLDPSKAESALDAFPDSSAQGFHTPESHTRESTTHKSRCIESHRPESSPIDSSTSGMDSSVDSSTSTSARPAIRLIQSQATDLSMIDTHSVDILSISYGLRNVLEYEQALREFARVLKPAGIVVVLDFFKKSSPSLLDRIIGIYTKHILPCIGYLISRNYAAYKYLPDSMEEFITPEELALAFERVGIKPVEIKSYSAGISHLVLGYVAHEG